MTAAVQAALVRGLNQATFIFALSAVTFAIVLVLDKVVYAKKVKEDVS